MPDNGTIVARRAGSYGRRCRMPGLYRAPAGWYCTRAHGHECPCAAHPADVEHDHSEVATMIERNPYRLWRARGPGLLLPERRDGFDRRALVAPAPGRQGVIRPGHGEAHPPRERRWDLSSGME